MFGVHGELAKYATGMRLLTSQPAQRRQYTVHLLHMLCMVYACCRDEALNVMLSAVPDCPNPRTLATLQYNIALCRAEQGDVQQALASARTALETAQKLTVTSEGGETSPQGQQDGEEQESLAVSCVLLVATLLTAR